MTDPFEIWAASRGGFFTRAEAKDYGYSDGDIRSATRERRWVRLRHGYYAAAAYIDRLDPRERHCLLASSVLHRLGPDYVLAGVSACAVHGVEVWDGDLDLDVVRVVKLGGRAGRVEAGVRFQSQAVEPALVERVNDVQVLGAADAVWQAACELSAEGALACFNSALNTGRVSREGLESIGSMYTRWRGSRVARLVYRLADPRIETVGESRTFFLCWRFNLPRPLPQYEIIDAHGKLVARTDFVWLEHRHVGEFDGRIKYVRYARPGESESDVVFREKQREDRVRAEGFGMSRLTWAHLEGDIRRERTATRLRHALAESKRLYAGNRAVLL